MIEMLEGVPGSGKSYYAVSERFLPWVRAHRKIYVYVEGIYLDKLALFEGRELEELQKQLVVWKTEQDVRTGLLDVEPGAAVLIDEAQTIFRAKDRVDPEILRWLETHRHRGHDVVLMVQQYGQVTLGVTRLVEVTTKFRRLDRFGLKNRYQAQVRGNPEETEVIRMFTGRYAPKVYSYYASYSLAAVREQSRGGSIMRSPTIVLGVLGLIGAAWWFASGAWLSAGPVTAKPAASAGTLPPPPVAGTPARSAGLSGASREVTPLRIQGGIESEKDGQPFWLWVTSDGRILTEEQIAAETGGTVIGYTFRGVRRLTGTGVRYGTEGLERVTEARSVAGPLAAGPRFAPSGPVLPPPEEGLPATGSKDPIATPPVSPEPPGMLATPPAF